MYTSELPRRRVETILASCSSTVDGLSLRNNLSQIEVRFSERGSATRSNKDAEDRQRWMGRGGRPPYPLFASGERRGAPVLLLHGGGDDCASLSYKHATGPISEHRRVLAPDWPGYGQSDESKMEYSTEYYVGFLGRLMVALGLEKASLVVRLRCQPSLLPVGPHRKCCTASMC